MLPFIYTKGNSYIFRMDILKLAVVTMAMIVVTSAQYDREELLELLEELEHLESDKRDLEVNKRVVFDGNTDISDFEKLIEGALEKAKQTVDGYMLLKSQDQPDGKSALVILHSRGFLRKPIELLCEVTCYFAKVSHYYQKLCIIWRQFNAITQKVRVISWKFHVITQINAKFRESFTL